MTEPDHASLTMLAAAMRKRGTELNDQADGFRRRALDDLAAAAAYEHAGEIALKHDAARCSELQAIFSTYFSSDLPYTWGELTSRLGVQAERDRDRAILAVDLADLIVKHYGEHARVGEESAEAAIRILDPGVSSIFRPFLAKLQKALSITGPGLPFDELLEHVARLAEAAP